MEVPVLDLVGPGTWVEEARVDLGGGASATFRGGVAVPIVDDDGVGAGFVFVGNVSTELPIAGGALSVRAAVPAADLNGSVLTTSGSLLIAWSRSAEFAEAAALGHPILDTARGISYLDEQGREVVVVTSLSQRAALADARRALRDRTVALTEVGLGPAAMLQRDAWREGEPRAIVELEPELDLRPLVATASDQADLVRPWLTWVVDPTGLVDDSYDGVVAVHGPVPQAGDEPARAWRALGGHPLTQPPALRSVRGVGNVVVQRAASAAATAELTVQWVVEATERGRLIDVWVPEADDQPNPNSLPIQSDPVVSLTMADGSTAQPVEVPFGVRRVEGSRLHTFLVDEPLPVRAPTTLRLHWTESWEIGGVYFPSEFADWAIPYHAAQEPVLEDLPDVGTLGQGATGLRVFPRLATDLGGYPVELRAGTSMVGWRVAAGSGGQVVQQEHGAMVISQGRAPDAVAVGQYREISSAAGPGRPAIRLLRHSPVDEDLLVSMRGILNFYDSALPAFPYPEVVVVQGQSRPVVLADVAVRPEASVEQVLPEFRYLGSGQLEYRGIAVTPVTIRVVDIVTKELRYIKEPPRSATSSDRPDALVRSLALALADGWWAELPWSDRDRWLSLAIPALYRDRFVEEAFGARELHTWDRYVETQFVQKQTSPLAGLEDDRARERGVRLLRSVMERIGEQATLRALARFRESEDATLASLCAALEAESGVSFTGFFEVFGVAGLAPEVSPILGGGNSVTFTVDPPVGTWELPVKVGNQLRWVTLRDGIGTTQATGKVEVDPSGLLPLTIRTTRAQMAASGDSVPALDEAAGAAGSPSS